MVHHFGNREPFIDLTVEHAANQVETLLGERQEGNPQRMVHDLVDVVEWVFLVYDRV